MTKLQTKIENHPRVWYLDVEPTDGWFVTLRPGWKAAHDPLAPTHCFGASTLTEAYKDVREALPCRCAQCVAELAVMTQTTKRFSVREAVATHLGHDMAELREYRYQPSRTPCEVYSTSSGYFTATKGRKPKTADDSYMGAWDWERVRDGLCDAYGWTIWKAIR
jgi:hypothetical protein